MTSQTPGTVRDALVALVRTVVPVIVGSLLSLAAQAGLHIDASTSELLTLILVAVCTAAYYALIRALSTRWAWVGWFLGYPTDPTYEPRHSAD
ncbi:hypothetical protein MUN77_01580 [Leucobacter allii]|uniref:hypothetical protein n=1 Tax=Leucobacter allii TaxID=2932247 RepID=UPI001FD0476C|nr:hypothetical protein [Leucobacter allii]UOR02050.1 hypothetical protein MUN77_01580 [Leucobacter allii]